MGGGGGVVVRWEGGGWDGACRGARSPPPRRRARSSVRPCVAGGRLVGGGRRHGLAGRGERSSGWVGWVGLAAVRAPLGRSGRVLEPPLCGARVVGLACGFGALGHAWAAPPVG